MESSSWNSQLQYKGIYLCYEFLSRDAGLIPSDSKVASSLQHLRYVGTLEEGKRQEEGRGERREKEKNSCPDIREDEQRE